jgi:hypothetical protein
VHSIVLDDQVFHPLTPGALYESSYESIILARASVLFPNYKCYRFNPMVSSSLGEAAPDLILVAEGFQTWVVVEVELASHSFNGHVRPQMERLASARYGAREAKWLADRNPFVDHERIADLMSAQSPRIFMIVNASVPTWEQSLRQMGIGVLVAEPFRNRLDAMALRLQGDSVPAPGDVLTRVWLGVDWLRRYIRLETSAPLNVTGDRIQLRVRGELVTCGVRSIGGEKYLIAPSGGFQDVDLPSGAGYLVRRDDGYVDLCDNKEV